MRAHTCTIAHVHMDALAGCRGVQICSTFGASSNRKGAQQCRHAEGADRLAGHAPGAFLMTVLEKLKKALNDAGMQNEQIN